MTDKQPEALRLADDLEILEDTIGDGICKEAAAELRRLYALNQELRERLAQPEQEDYTTAPRREWEILAIVEKINTPERRLIAQEIRNLLKESQ